MKFFIQKFFFLILGVSLTACSQDKKTMITQNPTITADNISEEIAKQVKNYSSEKIYAISFTNNKCYFDLYLNDIKVHRNFNGPRGNSAAEINNVVFKNGSQKISYKMYPAGKTEEYDEIYNTLTDDSYLEFELNSYDLKKEGEDDEVYMKYKTPTTELKISEQYSEHKFIATGKTYYEGSFTINVEVPYKLDQPFENAQDLKKLDKKELEAKLVKKYREIKDIYQNKEYDNIAKLAFDNLKNTFISSYESKEEIKNSWQKLIKLYGDSKIEMLPIENYKLEFFADGKLVALMTNSNDKKRRGRNALCGKIVKDKGESTFEIKHYFYIPQGKTEFNVY
ncbi:hypothetical protein BJQ96_00612 [Flavobacterium sp. PL0002]|nr:hypothetical protein [Flavobacterium sp. PL002]